MRCPLDTFEVVERGTRAEIEERALPFQVGDEVLVRIEEPHMYNVDDAVARVDSYIVSVTGGGRFVGDRRLVRIESVERSAATASLIDGPGDGSDTRPGGGGWRFRRIAGLQTAPRPARRQAPFPCQGIQRLQLQ